MSKTAAALLLALAAGAAGAQTADEISVERARIASERTARTLAYVEGRRACYQRFAVNDCLDDERLRHNEVMGDLRRQEIALNDLERAQRTAQRLRVLEERQSEERQQQEASRRREALEASRQRDERAADKAREADKAAEAAGQRAARTAQPRPAPSRPDEAANRERFERRQEQAARHKDEVLRKQQEAARPPRQPLPTPP